MPLTAIKGSTAMALGGPSQPDPAETRQLFRIIDGQADLLRGLINDLLDVTQVESGSLSFTSEPVDVNALVDHARTTFLQGGAANSIEVDLPPNLPRARAGKQRILQVLGKLFSNASRYSPKGSTIRVTASVADFHVAISVADESRGVSGEHLPALFEKFSRRGREAGGSGLGLAVCKGIVEAHGGRIWAESDGLEGGTRITFTIPVADRSEVRGAAHQSGGVRGRERAQSGIRRRPPTAAGRYATAISVGRSDDRLRRTHRVRGGPSGAADPDRVQAALRAFHQRRAGGGTPSTAGPGLGFGVLRRYANCTGFCERNSEKAGRRCPQPDVHLHPVSRRLPHGKTNVAHAFRLGITHRYPRELGPTPALRASRIAWKLVRLSL